VHHDERRPATGTQLPAAGERLEDRDRRLDAATGGVIVEQDRQVDRERLEAAPGGDALTARTVDLFPAAVALRYQWRRVPELADDGQRRVVVRGEARVPDVGGESAPPAPGQLPEERAAVARAGPSR
jgi:hypothetical protein